MESNTELILFVKLKHSSIFSDPEHYVNNLPDEVIDTFYEGRNWTLEEKRKQAIIFYIVHKDEPEVLIRDQEFALPILIEYYAKK